jgi:hypothetical protein
MIDTSPFPIVKLTALTHKGKNVIAQHGKHWFVKRKSRAVACLGGDTGLLLFPCVDSDFRNFRWVSTTGDKDFKIHATDK